MEFLPVFMRINDHPCLVVGGGEVAARKASLLLKAGARVTVISPELGPSLLQWKEQGSIHHLPREFGHDLDGQWSLIIACTDDEDTNKRVYETATEQNIPVNVVDNPSLCTFIMPSIIDRSPVIVAVSTGGSSPVLARLIRARLETLIPAAYGRLAVLANEFRDKVKAKFDRSSDRRVFWENVLQGSVAEMVFSGQEQSAKVTLDKMLDGDTVVNAGEVYLVGGGPGDPDLLTFRALRLMQQSDVIVHDRLVSQEVLDLSRRDAERIYVGKERDQHTLPQEDINELLVRLAREGKRVCRLKGGDPFIFGRGGEEIEHLMEEGIQFQVVPGITAASGVASYAGIPLTHRDYSQSVTFITGHLKDGTTNLNWQALAQPGQTIVFYMGLKGLDLICRELVSHGMPADTSVALVQKATTPEQKIFISDLENLPDKIHKADIKPPTLIIVGNVVRLHSKLNWFMPTGD